MRRTPQGGLAGAFRAVQELRPVDDATAARIVELLGAAPEADEPPPGDVAILGAAELDDRLVAAEPEPLGEEEARPRRFRAWGAPAALGLGLILIAGALGVLLAILPASYVLLGVGAALGAILGAWLLWRLVVQPVDASLTLASPGPDALPGWIEAAQPLAVPRRSAEPPVAPLLAPEWTRGILAVALSMNLDDGPLDTERLVDAIARDEIPERLPRLPHRSLSAGVQMLIDMSPSMQPFRADLIDIVAQVRRLVGDDAATILRFAGSPLDGAGPGRRATWRPYEPPATPRPVLVVSDLGLGPEPTLATTPATWEWLRLYRLAQTARCPVVALTPQRAADVPRVLRRAMAIVEWDRATTAAGAARAVRNR